jgi:hypothetical protein
MFDFFISWFKELQNNQLASTLVIVPAVGFIANLCKSVPSKIFNFIRGRLTISISVYSKVSRESFDAVDILVHSKQLKCISSNFIFSDNSYLNAPVIGVGLNTMFYGFIDGVFVTITKSYDDISKMDTGFVYHLVFYTRNIDKMHSILTSAYDNKDSTISKDTFRLMLANRWGDAWMPRTKSIVHRDTCTNQQKEIIDKISKIVTKDDFTKFGALLYGVPGGGKSKLLEALASVLRMRMYYFNIAQLSDELVIDALSKVKTPCIMVFEDIDCAKVPERKKEEKKDKQKSVDGADVKEKEAVEEENTKKEIPTAPYAEPPRMSLATLLNIFDGVLSLDKQIIIATTNYPDKLDSALKRKGRFDMTIELKPVDTNEATDIIGKYYGVNNKDIIRHAVAQTYTMIPLPVANVYAACKVADDAFGAVDILYTDIDIVDPELD